MTTPIIESLSHLIHPDGTKIQVVKNIEVEAADGSTSILQEWDEAETHIAYAQYSATKV